MNHEWGEVAIFVVVSIEVRGRLDVDRVLSTEVNQRTTDTNLLVGDSKRAYLELGWRHTTDFDSMASLMVKFDRMLLANPEFVWA